MKNSQNDLLFCIGKAFDAFKYVKMKGDLI